MWECAPCSANFRGAGETDFLPHIGKQLVYFEQGRILRRQVLEDGANLLAGKSLWFPGGEYDLLHLKFELAVFHLGQAE